MAMVGVWVRIVVEVRGNMVRIDGTQCAVTIGYSACQCYPGGQQQNRERASCGLLVCL